MPLTIEESVVLVKSIDPNSRFFGTGFVIYQEENATYTLTCTHVTETCGGKDSITVDGCPAKVIAYRASNDLDLSILKIDKNEKLKNKLPLPLSSIGRKGLPIYVVGYIEHDKFYHARRKISGVLGEQIYLRSKQHGEVIKVWDIDIEGDFYFLETGYSGSPIIDRKTEKVLGVVSYSADDGHKGNAISVENLRSFEKDWKKIPFDLLKDPIDLIIQQLDFDVLRKLYEIKSIAGRGRMPKEVLLKDFGENYKYLIEEKINLLITNGYVKEEKENFGNIIIKYISITNEGIRFLNNNLGS